mmetsp:Transcript_37099/g.93099  ORF Transcript_37099/g.93099 Transcript_37099/m.93099 type:complete len:348 (-) Transcript_37099:721-1764(-)
MHLLHLEVRKAQGVLEQLLLEGLEGRAVLEDLHVLLGRRGLAVLVQRDGLQHLQHLLLPTQVLARHVDHRFVEWFGVLGLLVGLLGLLAHLPEVFEAPLERRVLAVHDWVRGREGGPGLPDDEVGLREDVCPDVLADMGADRRQGQHMPLHPQLNGLPVHVLVAHERLVRVAHGLHVVEGAPQGLAVHQPGVGFPRVVDQDLELVDEHLINERLGATPQVVTPLDGLGNELLEIPKTEERRLGNLPLKVGVFECVSRVSQCESRGVGGELLDRLLEGQEVAHRLGHLLVVHHHVAVREERLRPEVRAFVPDGCVVVECHGEVVVDQVLARTPQVHRIPIRKLTTHQV